MRAFPQWFIIGVFAAFFADLRPPFWRCTSSCSASIIAMSGEKVTSDRTMNS